MQDSEVHDADDDLRHRDEGGHEHSPPLLDAPRQQHEGHAGRDHALNLFRQNQWQASCILQQAIQKHDGWLVSYGVEESEDLEPAGDDPAGEAALHAEADDSGLEEAEGHTYVEGEHHGAVELDERAGELGGADGRPKVERLGAGDYNEHEGRLGDGHPAVGEARVNEALRHLIR